MLKSGRTHLSFPGQNVPRIGVERVELDASLRAQHGHRRHHVVGIRHTQMLQKVVHDKKIRAPKISEKFRLENILQNARAESRREKRTVKIPPFSCISTKNFQDCRTFCTF